MTNVGRPHIGPVQKVRLPEALKDRLDGYASRRRISVPAAIREILDEKLQAVPILPTIWELFAEAKNDEGEDEGEDDEAYLDELYLGDGDDGETGEYEDATSGWYHGYKRIRGYWVYHRVDKTNEKDELGCTIWSSQYIVTASKADARQVYRDAVITASQHWKQGDPPVWAECGWEGDSVEQLGDAGLIPKGTYTSEN